VTAAVAAGLGARVALVERALLGGDCLNVGCVPSKALISAARAAAAIAQSSAPGIRLNGEAAVDFPTVMERLRRVRASISAHDSAERFRSLGVDVFLGEGRFLSADRLDVAGAELRFSRAVIATGGRPAGLEIPGFENNCLTNETVFSLTQRPPRLLVIGGGPIGCELAQAFARLGSQVTLVTRGTRLLTRDDPDASAVIQQALEGDGVRLLFNSQVLRIDREGDVRGVSVETEGRRERVDADQILLAVGRRPNVEGLGLEDAGVAFDQKRGIQVDDFLRTTNRRIFAAGDVCSSQQFTHAADFMARIVVRNSLFYGRARMSRLVIPRCTYTSPEVAHVGLTPLEAREGSLAIRTITIPLSAIDRAVVSGETDGLIRIHARGRSDRIVGATIVAPHAGEMISEVALAMTHSLGLKALASTIHPYPTIAEGLRKAGDQFNAGRLSPWVRRVLAFWFR
jgi:pyruvate/2-oxoglutarate dehydrogenase complex dihydrolipoamide dehydrogenase (E3) component